MMYVDPVQELHRAAEQGDIEYVKSALEDGVDIDSPDHDNNTALHIASANDHEVLVAFLLSKNSNREATNNLGWTPLMQAARHGHMHVVLLLVQAGASVDTRNRLGMTALMLASVSGHMGTIRMLIDAGANFDPVPSINTCQITPLMIAAQHGNDAVVRLYLDKGVNANKSIPKTGALCDIMDASRRGDVKAVQEILLTDPSQCQVPTADGATPLMVAAMLGHVQVAQALLQYGAHIDAQDHKNGWTSLMQAIYHRQTEMAKFLIQCGADISKVSHKGYTAFDFAKEMLDIDVMRIFAEAQMMSLGIGTPSPTPQPGWPQQTSNYSADFPDGHSKHGLKQWWNRVSNRFHKVKGIKPQRTASPERDSLREISLVPPLAPMQYDPILPQEIRLPPIMDFGAGSIHVTETMKSMVPPHISPTGGKPGFVSKAMPPGRKILPGGPVEPPRHATNSRLLKWSMGSGGSSPGSSLSGPSLQSSGESKCLGSILQANGPKGNKNSDGSRERHYGKPVGENDVLVSSLDSEGSGGSSLKTVTSKSSKSSKSSRSTATLVPDVSEEADVRTASSDLTLSLGSGQLSEVLQKLALKQYLDLFIDQEVDLDAFLELSDTDLEDLGITTASAKNKILGAIASLKSKLQT
ncbi:ankyrin repeat and SAM domain-containing protein 6 isoform X3 [Procambarus clarkii]|uniref:ankyrin repeat and SAM domain-containing protein 6 isoform X3 n=1 Tax=Procambarus clarkii TaxID=6728 RepID=UPI0037448FD7